MTTEHILDAIGLLDDDLIQEAERYAAGRRRPNYGIWLGWAASFAVVLVLGYGMTHLSVENGANSGGASMNQGSGAAETLPGENSSPSLDAAGGGDIAEPNAPGNNGAAEGESCAAIMVDGVVYWSTGTPAPGEVEESAIQTVTGYTSTVPEMDGQTNFSRDLSARYAMTDMGLVVWIDGEWILFDPVPPWER